MFSSRFMLFPTFIGVQKKFRFVRRRRPSSVVVNFSLKILISQKLPDNFFSFLVYSFLRKVPMYCIHIDLIESS